MDIYIARQPIFSNNMRLFGYELLYRRSLNNFYEGSDHNAATIDLVYNAFLVMGINTLTDGTRGFINFTQDLLEQDIPSTLPKDQVVIEVLESVTANETIVEACRKLKASGYAIALDDFVFNRTDQDYTPLIELADIIKIEFPTTDKNDQIALIRKYKQKKFLAEKVETREEYQEAVKMGYELFQGYFFSKPVILTAKEIGSLNVHMVSVLEELQRQDPDFSRITDTIQKDMGMSVKLLKMINSVYYGGTQKIKNLRQAVVRLGTHEMKRWVSLMLLREFETVENSELIKVCLLRARLLGLIALELKQPDLETDYFLTGLLSSIDVIVNNDMDKILESMALSPDVKAALLGENGKLKNCLDCILKYERFEFEEVRIGLLRLDITLERFMDLYVDALSWLKTTNG
jgi:EAL and modified HD-GYP domain-containing signal transduction protein